MWARIHLIPALQAEEDRDQVRRYLADKAREKELLGTETKVYHSDRYVTKSLEGTCDCPNGDIIGLFDQHLQSHLRTRRNKREENEVKCTYKDENEIRGRPCIRRLHRVVGMYNKPNEISFLFTRTHKLPLPS